MQFYVYLACVCPSKWYHNIGGFVCGKACVSVFSFPNLSPYPPIPQTQPIIITNYVTSYTITPDNLAIITALPYYTLP